MHASCSKCNWCNRCNGADSEGVIRLHRRVTWCNRYNRKATSPKKSVTPGYTLKNRCNRREAFIYAAVTRGYTSYTSKTANAFVDTNSQANGRCRCLTVTEPSGAETPAARICQLVATFISRYATQDSRTSTVATPTNRGFSTALVTGSRSTASASTCCVATPYSKPRRVMTRGKSATPSSRRWGDGEHLTIVTRTPRGDYERFYYVDPEKLDLGTCEK
jgi:hypothetical protein